MNYLSFVLKYIYEDEETLSGTIINKAQSSLELTQGETLVNNYSSETSFETAVEIPAKVIVHHYIYDKENDEYTTAKIA